MELDHSAARSRVISLLGVLILTALLAACGGGGGGGGNNLAGGGSGGSGGSGSGWQQGVFAPAGNFEARCANPRGGTWPDVQGTTLDENNFLRSYSNDTYLWYDEITDRDPGSFNDPLDYFETLKTFDVTLSGNPKDQFHFTFDTDEWIALSQSGVSAGYGAQFTVLQAAPPRLIVVAYTDPNTPATDNGLVRGAELLAVDGVDAVNDNTQAGVDVLNSALFPSGPGETYTFDVRDPDGTERSFSMTSQEITSTPVQNVGTLPNNPDVGYLLFNDHIATAEDGLVDAITQLDAAGISDLVIDIRYNGGGFLAIAAQLAYMVAGPAQTDGRTFELQQFNDKHPTVDPVTGAVIAPIPFVDETLGFAGLAAGQSLPSLGLTRVFVLTGSDTCSASEAIMNGLRGVNVEVIQIGSTTCGKPYGFYPTDNCGTTFFTIQFRGVNDANFGDYADGFSPVTGAQANPAELPGCPVGDDFSAALGDAAEARLAAALFYRANGSCPAPSPRQSAPATASLRLSADQPVTIPKPPWRTNRLLGGPRSPAAGTQ